MLTLAQKICARSATKPSRGGLVPIIAVSCPQSWRLPEHSVSIVIKSRLLLWVHGLLELHETLENLIGYDLFRGILRLLLWLRLVVHYAVEVRIQQFENLVFDHRVVRKIDLAWLGVVNLLLLC